MMPYDDAVLCAKYLFTQIEDYWPSHKSSMDLKSWATFIQREWNYPVEDFAPAVDHFVSRNEPKNAFGLANHLIRNGDLWNNWAQTTGDKGAMRKEEKILWAAQRITRNAPALRTLLFMIVFANGEGRVRVHIDRPFNGEMEPEVVWKAMEWLDEHGLIRQDGDARGKLVPFRVQFGA